MKIVNYDPKKDFGLVYKVYPFVDEDADIKGWEFSYGVSSNGDIEIFGRQTTIDDAQKYLVGLAQAISLAEEAG